MEWQLFTPEGMPDMRMNDAQRRVIHDQVWNVSSYYRMCSLTIECVLLLLGWCWPGLGFPPINTCYIYFYEYMNIYTYKYISCIYMYPPISTYHIHRYTQYNTYMYAHAWVENLFIGGWSIWYVWCISTLSIGW